jgi:hypothetical protein
MGLCFCLVYREVRRWTYASVVADAFAYYGLESQLAFVEHGDVGLWDGSVSWVATAGHVEGLCYCRAAWDDVM